MEGRFAPSTKLTIIYLKETVHLINEGRFNEADIHLWMADRSLSKSFDYARRLGLV